MAMATSSKRITRKALRQPDWFQVTTEKALDLFAHHRAKVLTVLVALAVLLLVISGWQIFKARHNAAASKEFGSALSLYQAQKYREAIAEFQKVQGYRWSRYAALGYLYEANSYISLGETDKATRAAERFLAATSPDSLYRQLALMTLGSVEEAQKQCKQAIGRYGEAEKIKNALQQEARLGKARCAEQLGDIQVAIASYRDYVKDDPESYITVRLAELEAKAGEQKLAK
jgi:predicted negative regulator of RcsB-dependent stress response